MSKKSFREIGGNKVYRGWKNWIEGEFIVGKLTGTSTDNYGKTNWHIEIEETNIEDDGFGEGVVVGLNSCGSLDYKMESVEQGETVYIEYNGQTELQKGKFAGKLCHDVVVKVSEPEGSEEQSDFVASEGVESFTDL